MTSATAPAPSARRRLLDQARDQIRAQGFAATTVDALCQAAGVTKGAFFHHFRSKEDLGVQAARDWDEGTSAFFATAPYHRHPDPLDRVLGYLEFRRAIISGGIESFSCLIGTMVQETYASSPAIRAACEVTMTAHTDRLARDIAEAMHARAMPEPEAEADSLAQHMQAVLQGAFVMAKVRNDPEVALSSLAHLRRYVMLLFSRTEPAP